MRGARTLALLGCMAAGPAAASTLFSDGFEACCTVGGTVRGLAGSGLVLRLQAGAVDESLAIDTDGGYRFSAALGVGVAYAINVQAQPAAGPACRVLNAGGSMPAAPVRDVDIVCSEALLWDDGDWGEDWQ